MLLPFLYFIGGFQYQTKHKGQIKPKAHLNYSRSNCEYSYSAAGFQRPGAQKILYYILIFQEFNNQECRFLTYTIQGAAKSL